MGTPRTPSTEVGPQDRVRCPDCFSLVQKIGPGSFFLHRTEQPRADLIGTRIIAWRLQSGNDAEGRHKGAA
jgi:hypothetical protein